MSFALLFQMLGCLCLASAVLLTLWYIERAGYKRGYSKGRHDTEEWIVRMEAEVDQARQKIWRSEG